MTELPHDVGHDPAAAEASGTEQDAPLEPVPPRRLLKPDPKAVTLWRLEILWRGVVLAVPVLLLEIAVDLPVRTGTGAITVAVLTLLLAWLVPPARYRAWGYALRERDLYREHGILFRTASIAPHARIQHVDTRQGPVDRWLGLASVVVFTAGTRGAILEIPALDSERAETLRDRLAELSGEGDAV